MLNFTFTVKNLQEFDSFLGNIKRIKIGKIFNEDPLLTLR